MSRVGRMPIAIPAGVTVSYDNSVVTVKGPLGTLTQNIEVKNIDVKVEGGTVQVSRSSDQKNVRAAHGLYRQLVSNMVSGVKEYFKRTLIVFGVGYRVAVNGNKLVLNLGFSQPVEFIIPQDLKVTASEMADKDKKRQMIVVEGISKERVGHFAASIKAKRPVEPYHGYGIHYSDETVVRKEGKTSGKK